MENLSELKALFYKEHARDRRLTLINYGLILGLIGLVLGFLLYLGVDFKKIIFDFLNQNVSDNSWVSLYAKYAPIIAFVVICAYPFYVLVKLSKRPKQIDKLIARAEKGAKMVDVAEVVEYKLTLPLLKVNFKFCPVTSVMITLDGELKAYVLPLNKFYIPDMKILLSGVNVDEINKHKDALYGEVEESAEAENVVATPLKSVDEFRVFINSDMKEDIEALESSRKSSRKVMIVGGILCGILIVGVMGYIIYTSLKPSLEGDYNQPFNPMTTIVPFFVMVLLITIIANVVMRKRTSKSQISAAQTEIFGNNSFKEKIISRMISFINSSVKYIPMAHLSLGDIFESGLFEERNYTLDGSDQISGRHNGVPFISCDLSLYFKRNFSDEKDGPDCAFYGQFFVARFNKTFSTPVYIIPKKNKYDTLSYLVGGKGETIKLEDPEFNGFSDRKSTRLNSSH